MVRRGVTKQCQRAGFGFKPPHPPTMLLSMNEEIAFLFDAAEQLRELALTEPQIAANLRRLATELEASAVELRRSRPGLGRLHPKGAALPD
jgi:hypothetical protein